MGISSLDSALAGLRVSQQQISVISNNVSNVNTEGFTRKILPQTAQTVNGVTVGSLAGSIIRRVDINLERDLWTQISATSTMNIQQKYLSKIETFHGPPASEISVASEVARLRDTFSLLADDPDDALLQSSTLSQAQDTAAKINNLSNLITTSRNDAQNEMFTTIGTINSLLREIASYNGQIQNQVSVGRSTASTEDARSKAIKDLSELIGITSFRRGDGVITVQTLRGIELVSDRARELTFNPSPLSAQAGYPGTAAGVYVGDPVTSATAIDITDDEPGGKLGGLIELRDTTFPKQMAQLDELAHKMALRFNEQGLRLFTDAAGSIPDDDAPTPNTTAVSYVGFSAQIRVNSSIIADNTLLQRGTYGASMSSGDNEVIRRVLEYSFTDTNYQRAIGDLDLSAATGTLQDFLGIRSHNTVNSGTDLTDYSGIAALIAGQPSAFSPTSNTFRIVFDDPDIGSGPYNIDIDLNTVTPSGVNAAQDLIDAITADADWANIVTDFGASITIGANGQLVFQSRGDIEIEAGSSNSVTDTGFAFLGLSVDTFEATDPYFDIKVGNDEFTRITIAPDDDEADLLAKLQAVPGLAVEDFTTSTDGFLRLRPGNDYDLPDFGGDITITSGPFEAVAANASANTLIGAGTIVNGINLISALFGTFSGSPAQNVTPITNVLYGSETDASLAPPIPTKGYRTDYLGPSANISTNIAGATGLVDFAQKLVNEQTQELLVIKNAEKEEGTLRQVLEEQMINESGVNLDEELGNLVVMQSAYAAAARVINAVSSMFDELLSAI